MKELEIQGKTYKKISAAAKDFGYTPDYIGQLCRAGKVDAKQLGRSWYVSIASLAAHKENTYRSNLEKSKQAVQEYLLVKGASNTLHVPESTSKKYLRFAPVKSATANQYHADDAVLFPEIKKTPSTHRQRSSLPVVAAGAQKLAVQKKSVPYSFTSTESPDISFTGQIDVASAEENNYFDPKYQLKHSYSEFSLDPKSTASSVSATKGVGVSRQVVSHPKSAYSIRAHKVPQTLERDMPVEHESSKSVVITDASRALRTRGRYDPFMLAATLLIAGLVFFASVSITSTVTYVEGNATVAYSIGESVLQGLKINAFK